MEAGFLLYVLSAAWISWYIFSTLFTIFRPIKSTLYSVFYMCTLNLHYCCHWSRSESARKSKSPATIISKVESASGSAMTVDWSGSNYVWHACVALISISVANDPDLKVRGSQKALRPLYPKWKVQVRVSCSGSNYVWRACVAPISISAAIDLKLHGGQKALGL